jgi:hypothetical protein
MKTLNRLRRILLFSGPLLGVLVAVACDTDRPAEFHIELEPTPLRREAMREQIERVLEQRAAELELGSVSVELTSDTTGTVRFERVPDLSGVAKVIEFQGAMEWRWTDMDNRFLETLPTIDQALIEAGVAVTGSSVQPSPLEQLLDAEPVTADTAPAPDRGGPLGNLLSERGIPGEFLVQEEHVGRVDSLLRLPEVERAVPRGVELLWAARPVSRGERSYRPLYSVERRAVLANEQVQDATATIDAASERAVVLFRLTSAGARRFGRETRQHVNHFLAIVVDGLVFGRPPVVRDEIGRHGQIDLGQGEIEVAQDLALALRAGALPVRLTVVRSAWVER